MALGVDGEYTYREGGCIGLSAGQIVLIGTDGLWETHNEAGEMFGKARLKDIIRQKAMKPAEAIIRSIIQAVREFRGSAKQDDDITLAVIKIVDY